MRKELLLTVPRGTSALGVVASLAEAGVKVVGDSGWRMWVPANEVARAALERLGLLGNCVEWIVGPELASDLDGYLACVGEGCDNHVHGDDCDPENPLCPECF